MESLDEKIIKMREHRENGFTKIMILGFGSVGEYLLDYLLNSADEKLKIILVGRNLSKMESNANIIKIASRIREKNKSQIIVDGSVDFNDIEALTECFIEYQPDIIVNSSRVYAGLKYGSISWKTIRAYGIWAPLSIRYIKNIMEAYEKANCDAIVINTSYSDVVIPWLRSAHMRYPDFGSGNLNHLVPRIQYAAAFQKNIEDYWNIDVTYASSHFHDMVISKEGQTEGIPQLIDIYYKKEKLEVDLDDIFKRCKIPMPVDAKRNMMNASSNYQIIASILDAVDHNARKKLHIPGAMGEIGGYPVIIDGMTGKDVHVYIDESHFSLDTMRVKNRESIYLDGIESVENGTLVYTDELLEKVEKEFHVKLKKRIEFLEIDHIAQFLIKEIIEKFSQKSEGSTSVR